MRERAKTGSGKTTTLTMLPGFEQQFACRIFVGADDIARVPVESHPAVVDLRRCSAPTECDLEGI